MHQILFLIFFTLLGACVGSFLNVVAWRLPRVEMQEHESWPRAMLRTLHALSYPPSHCPKCNTALKWYDNVPVVGWLALRGKCRYCGKPISIRYPIVEALCAILFGGLYALLFMTHLRVPLGPTTPEGYTIFTGSMSLHEQWPIFGLYLVLIAGLLAASLIDLDLYIIPIEIPYLIFPIALIVHVLWDQRKMPGAVMLVWPVSSALAAGATVGLILSAIGFMAKWIPRSFAEGEPILDIDREIFQKEIDTAIRAGEPYDPLPPPYTRRQVSAEIFKEIAFLLPPIILGISWTLLTLYLPKLNAWWVDFMLHHRAFSAFLGSILGAMIGAMVVWLARILGTLALGRVAMGLGDVHLMFGVGAVIGAMGATEAFFIAPFFALLIAVWAWASRKQRELPFGPYLSMATVFVLIYSCRIWAYFQPAVQNIGEMLFSQVGSVPR